MAKGFTHESTYNESKEWYTPRDIFTALKLEFDLDPCSPGQDIVPWIPAQIHYTYLDDGLVKKWFGKVINHLTHQIIVIFFSFMQNIYSCKPLI